ncbi:aldehyde dehydrogenase family protein [Agromyces bauzanensis]
MTELALPELPASKTWIDGCPEPSAVAEAGTLHDPNTGERLSAAPASSLEQVERAIGAAHAAHEAGTWRELGAEGRAPVLERFADELDALAEDIARLDAVNSGVPISVTRLFGGSNGDTLRDVVARSRALGDSRRLDADHGDVRLHREPWGATALIMPWNAPSAMAVKKVAYALAAGATTVLKPSPASPWSTELVVEAAHRAGVPSGAVNLVYGGGDVGGALVADPRIRAISMTGSTPTGRAIAAAAAPNLTRLRLELGSNNPAIVRADAEIEATAAALVSGSMKLSGQWCEAPRRVIVHNAIIDDLVDALVAELGRLRIGSSLDEGTTLGPVAFEARRAELESQLATLEAEGARVLRVGEERPEGWFFRPTVAVSDTVDLELEIFGPLLTVQPAASDAEALRLANAGHVGLAGYVFGRDEDAARALGRGIRAGEIKVNGTSVLDMAPESAQSFFGASGIGGHGDADVLDFFSGVRVVGVDRPGLPL